MGRRKRVVWTIVDQAFSSISNFGLGIVIAHVVAESAFGAYGVGYAVYLLSVGLSRAVCTDPLLARHSVLSATQRTAVRRATGCALLAGFAAAAVVATVAAVAPRDLSSVLLGLAVGLPGLLLQDALRMSFFALGRPAQAVLNDAIWIVAQICLFTLLFARGDPGLGMLVTAWGLSATIAALVGLGQAQILPAVGALRLWWRANGDLSWRFAGDFLAMVGSQQLTLYAVAATAGLAASGALRAGAILLGPVGIAYYAAQIVAVPEGARLRVTGMTSIRRMFRGLATLLPCVGGAWVILLLLLPSGVGKLVLAENWRSAYRVLPYLGVAACLAGVTFAANSGLRCLADGKRTLRARLIAFVVKSAGGVAGAMTGGAVGAAAGMAATDGAAAWIWWSHFSAGVAAEAAATVDLKAGGAEVAIATATT